MTSDYRRRVSNALAIAIVAVLPAACAAPGAAPSSNPFVGTWANQDGDKITFRADTVVLDQPSGPGTALDKTTCRGVFHFGYATKNRDVLTGLISRQPDLHRELAGLLTAPDYKVAELGCDQGDNTYILLGDRSAVAVYRDGDIGAIVRLSKL